jgi:hypothetical protein
VWRERYSSNADRSGYSFRSEMLSRLNIALNMRSFMDRRGILVARTDEADGETSSRPAVLKCFGKDPDMIGLVLFTVSETSFVFAQFFSYGDLGLMRQVCMICKPMRSRH